MKEEYEDDESIDQHLIEKNTNSLIGIHDIVETTDIKKEKIDELQTDKSYTSCTISSDYNLELKILDENVHLNMKSNPNADSNYTRTCSGSYMCRFCSYIAPHKCWMNRHVQGVHLKTKVYYCAHCNYQTSMKGNLVQHITAIHEKSQTFSCTFCSFTSARKRSLVQHVSGVHHKKKPYNCDLCSYKYVPINFFVFIRNLTLVNSVIYLLLFI